MNTEQRIADLFGKAEPAKPNTLPPASEQQQAILDTPLNLGESLKVEASAGSGKTTSMLWLSWAKGTSARLLYICFSNKGAQEAREKYQAAGIHNTRISTIHGLASGTKALYEKAGKFQTKLTVKDIQKHHPIYTQRKAWEILETIKNFCESDKTRPEMQHVPELPGLDAIARNRIAVDAAKVWETMIDLKHPAPLSYDHYLKIYELTDPRLNYDYILLDEGQDSNPLTLSLLKKQQGHTRTIIIGDSHQGIYKWRGAQDAMKQWEAKHSLPLSESFRFGKTIAAAANTLLKMFCGSTTEIRGHKASDSMGMIPRNQSHTLIARTNATLFEEALSQIGKGRKFHFVGTQKARYPNEKDWDPSTPYRFTDAMDVYKLWTGDRKSVRNPHIQAFETYAELKEAATGVNGGGDKELESLCRIVEKHKRKLPDLIAEIVKNSGGPEQADILLVTCHRSKGLEWANVKLADDFAQLVITNPDTKETRLAVAGTTGQDCDLDEEEINLIYVAVTRAMNRLEINPRLEEFFRRVDLMPNHIRNAPDFREFIQNRRAVPKITTPSPMFDIG